MRYAEGAEGARDAAARWDITTPSRPGRLPGVCMAGFRDRTTDLVGLHVVPYPAVTVAVDCGDGLLLDDATGRQQRGSAVLGLVPGSVRVSGRNTECLQVRLSPVAAHAVLGASPEPGGAVVALDDLWGRDALRIQEQLRAAASWEDRFTIAEAALARRGHEAGRAVDPEVAHAWRQMVINRGQVRVEPLAAEVGWSRKRLWARFRSQIGLTPKRAAQLVRFDHAAHRLAAGHSAALVAAESGFVDQSHLHRDVLAFAGVTPTAVAAAPWLAVDDVAWAATPPKLR
ncbi:helix-turn-helix domain-containing protein [Streptomyces sp. NPDC001339]|uniref:AraC family transcriptional regulator n=1 Tax=Streptomyces sp. NPDC001339 TaxID=3364563 RepID=UPI0036C379D1